MCSAEWELTAGVEDSSSNVIHINRDAKEIGFGDGTAEPE